MNHCLIIGRVKNGPKLSYTSAGVPVCRLAVEVEDIGKGSETFTPTGIAPGAEIQVRGKLK